MTDKYVIELTIIDKENVVKYIPIVKRHFDLSIGEIRRNVLEERPIVICHYNDNPEELIKLSSMIKELKGKGANIKIIRNIKDILIEEIGIEIAENLIQRGKEIDEEVDRIIDLETGEEDDEMIDDEPLLLKVSKPLDSEEILTLPLENGGEVDCFEVARFHYQEKEYIALMLLTEKMNNKKPDILFFGLVKDEDEDEDEEPDITNIPDETEYEAVAGFFENLIQVEYVD
jgi:hypothetical protein